MSAPSPVVLRLFLCLFVLHPFRSDPAFAPSRRGFSTDCPEKHRYTGEADRFILKSAFFVFRSGCLFCFCFVPNLDFCLSLCRPESVRRLCKSGFFDICFALFLCTGCLFPIGLFRIGFLFPVRGELFRFTDWIVSSFVRSCSYPYVLQKSFAHKPLFVLLCRGLCAY